MHLQRDFYSRYLQCCNERRFGELGEFVAVQVQVNGNPQTLHAYAEGLASVVDLFPDWHWELQHLLIDGEWLSVHLLDSGTSAAGRPVTVREFAFYRLADRKIVEVWGDLDRDRLTA